MPVLIVEVIHSGQKSVKKALRSEPEMRLSSAFSQLSRDELEKVPASVPPSCRVSRAQLSLAPLTPPFGNEVSALQVKL